MLRSIANHIKDIYLKLPQKRSNSLLTYLWQLTQEQDHTGLIYPIWVTKAPGCGKTLLLSPPIQIGTLKIRTPTSKEIVLRSSITTWTRVGIIGMTYPAKWTKIRMWDGEFMQFVKRKFKRDNTF